MSIKTLMEEVRPLVLKEVEIETREQSILMSIFGLFGLSRFQCKTHTLNFRAERRCAKNETLD